MESKQFNAKVQSSLVLVLITLKDVSRDDEYSYMILVYWGSIPRDPAFFVKISCRIRSTICWYAWLRKQRGGRYLNVVFMFVESCDLAEPPSVSINPVHVIYHWIGNLIL